MAPAPLEKLKVVVIDDNEHMRTLLRAMLTGLGFRHIHVEENGKAGFAALQKVKPDLVLTDFSMQPVDGVEFVRMVRGLNSPLAWVPVIMITGHNERHYIEQARDSGATEILTKPVSPRDLFLRFKEVIERPRPFVKAPSFIGPDRRRKRLPASQYPKRRQADFDVEVEFR